MITFLKSRSYTDSDEQRRSRLLSLLSLGLGCLAFVVGVGVPISLLQQEATADIGPIVISALAFIVASAASWFLNRSGHLQPAAWIFVGAFTLSVGQAVWGRSGQGLHYFILPVMVSGAVLGRRAGFGMATISAAFVIWFGSQNHQIIEAFTAFGGVCAAAVVTWLTSSNVDTISKELRMARRDLDRRAMERTEELDGACQQALTRLQILDERKTDFLIVTSHELRTPLTALHGYTHLLSQKTLSPELTLIQQGLSASADRLIRLVNDLLDMARLDLAMTDLASTRVSLAEIVPAALHEFVGDVQLRSIDMQLSGLERLPRLYADPDLLFKLFCHLLSNAIKYTPDGGRIVVSGRSKRYQDIHGIEITVADSGIGISPEALPLIFEKFYREDSYRLYSSSRTRFKGGGPGLGLAIARGIVKAHHGEIWAVSGGRDEITCPGSVLHVWLPVETR